MTEYAVFDELRLCYVQSKYFLDSREILRAYLSMFYMSIEFRCT